MATVVELLRGVVGERKTGADAGRILVGLVGRGIQASRSPAMHDREAARLGIAYSYLLIDFDQLGLPDESLGEVIAAAGQCGFRGLNVTHPFKQAVMAHVDELAPAAEAIGAVNVVVFGDKRLGLNTDSLGFAESFRSDMLAAVAVDRVVQFGAGGAGAAVAYALLDLGVRDLAVIDSDAAKTADLVRRMAPRFAGRVRAESNVSAALAAADGIVNATPVGMDSHPGTPFDTRLLTPQHWVADIIYFPAETELLRRARALGCRTLGGAGMTICQAVHAFELWSGLPSNRSAMAAHFAAPA